MRKFQVITLFPDMLTGVFENSMMWKAQKDQIVQLSSVDLRDFGLGKRKVVEDTPYGKLLSMPRRWTQLQRFF